MIEHGKIFPRKGMLMGDMLGAKITVTSMPSSAYDHEILDWDVPSINASAGSTRIRVRIRDVQPEPMLDA